MKKTSFTLTAIALGLSVLAAPTVSVADFSSFFGGDKSESAEQTSANKAASNVAQSAVNSPFITNSLAPMLEKVLPAVVSIAVEGNQKIAKRSFDIPEEFKFFFGEDFFGDNSSKSSSRKFRGLGSGVIINAEKGYVLTNNHVIDNADKITVLLQDGREFKGKILGKDSQSDIALVQLENPKNLTEIKFADSDKLRVGDFTVAIGNPFGLGQTVTSGIISALGRSTGSDSGAYENYIQTDAAVNQGNSGGPLINLNGELIGINTAILSPSGANAGIAFAIPSNMANNLAQQIGEFGEVRRGMLGIKGGELNADLAKAFHVDAQQGAFVSEVLPGSAADKAGIKAGDVIIAMNGQKVSSFAEMRAKIATSGAGKEIELTYLRDNKKENVKVTLQADDQAQSTANAEAVIPALEGAELTNFNENGKKGVKLSKVAENSPAAQRGLKTGDLIIGVNRIAIEDLTQLRKAMENKDSVIALNIERGNNNFYLLIQ
ncbi:MULTISPECIES: Do family serine endopeptidase [Basfia]|uniref:DegQ protein n=2 Tax=Basfia TaxID=697331 RepID=Q65TW0_MANSM|nr:MULTISPECIES: Do family serine endopeptidase [Basfia]AAU37600.1 DegQ protein [[Mannheimia] succiniciproducens MBEL55E]QIM68378.1 serine peptidase [Basfia succiniciproducens]SCX90648.1 serine protease DegQ [Basfia succiniciproducens]SEQ55779.1 serine protease DegQ [Basfia succiniciproducens]